MGKWTPAPPRVIYACMRVTLVQLAEVDVRDPHNQLIVMRLRRLSHYLVFIDERTAGHNLTTLPRARSATGQALVDVHQLIVPDVWVIAMVVHLHSKLKHFKKGVFGPGCSLSPSLSHSLAPFLPHSLTIISGFLCSRSKDPLQIGRTSGWWRTASPDELCTP